MSRALSPGVIPEGLEGPGTGLFFGRRLWSAPAGFSLFRNGFFATTAHCTLVTALALGRAADPDDRRPAHSVLRRAGQVWV
jgi:hypothetical protein